VATGSYFDRKFNRLVNYSKDTGGDTYFGAKSNTFDEFYSRITEEARNQYTLAFAPKGERKVDYHTLEVRVRREGLTILTREGYYGGTFAPLHKIIFCALRFYEYLLFLCSSLVYGMQKMFAPRQQSPPFHLRAVTF
jgi:hypothetical protein